MRSGGDMQQILIVDDEPDIRRLIRIHLERSLGQQILLSHKRIFLHRVARDVFPPPTWFRRTT